MTYIRCLSELRKYNSSEQPNLRRDGEGDTHNFKLDNFVALCDTDDPSDPMYNNFRVGRLINIADGQAHIQNYAITSKNLAQAI